MSSNTTTHDPSHYRKLIREQKSTRKRHIKKLISEAKEMDDAYYICLALIRLSEDPQLSLSEASAYAIEAIKRSENIPRHWRRAEVLAKLAKHAKNWRGRPASHHQQKLLNRILQEIKALPKGKALSQNIGEISKHIGSKRISDVLTLAIQNNEYALQDSRSVIRQWAMKYRDSIPAEIIYTKIKEVNDEVIQTKLFGYLYLQTIKYSIPYPKAFHTATQIAINEKTTNKTKALRYLIRHISIKKDFLYLKDILLKITDPAQQSKLLITLAAQADKNGYKTISLNLFNHAKSQCKQVSSNQLKSKIKLTIAKGLYKANQQEEAKQILQELNQQTDDYKMQTKIEKTMEKYGFKKTNKIQRKKTIPVANINPSSFPQSTTKILTLYDTYEGSLKPIHFRMVARAAPLCCAFGLDLALMGFPVQNLKLFIEKAIHETTIAKGGDFIRYLFRNNRIHLLKYTEDNLSIFHQNEILIATTEQPDEKKNVSFDQLFKKEKNQSKKTFYILMGLGKKGLPASLLKKVPYHVEITGLNIPIETSTAMGIITYQIHNALSSK